MKSIYALAIAAVVTFGFMSCGPSEAERKADSVTVDSTRKEMHNTEDHLIDSINKAMQSTGSATDTTKKK